MGRFRSWLHAFGKGLGGVLLSFIGIGTIPTIFWFFENLNQSIGYASPHIAINLMIIIPVIILVVGGTSFYYGIKIIKE